MAQAVDGGRPKDPVGKGVGPFGHIQVGSDNRAFAFIAFCNDVMEVLILVGLERLQAKIVDDQEIHARQFGKVAVIAVDGPGGIQLGEHTRYAGKQDIVSGPDGAVAQGLGDMAFTLMESFP